jgi:hypothetical protein
VQKSNQPLKEQANSYCLSSHLAEETLLIIQYEQRLSRYLLAILLDSLSRLGRLDALALWGWFFLLPALIMDWLLFAPFSTFSLLSYISVAIVIALTIIVLNRRRRLYYEPQYSRDLNMDSIVPLEELTRDGCCTFATSILCIKILSSGKRPQVTMRSHSDQGVLSVLRLRCLCAKDGGVLG